MRRNLTRLLSDRPGTPGRWLIGLAALLIAHSAASQSEVVVLLSADSDPYSRFYSQLEKNLAVDTGSELALHRQVLGRLENPGKAFDGAGLCISVGIDAAEYLGNSGAQCKQIHAFVPRLLYQRKRRTGEIACGDGPCRALVIDQPLQRQFALIRFALPDTRRVAVVLSSYSEDLRPTLQQAAARYDIQLATTHLQDSEEIVAAVSGIIPRTQALLTLPDPLVYNAYTARAVLLSTYRAGIPVIAYSASYVRAGALLGIYSTPEQIADHATELLKRPDTFEGKGLIHPRYFTLKKNASVQESLNIELPTLYTLKRKLRGINSE